MNPTSGIGNSRDHKEIFKPHVAMNYGIYLKLTFYKNLRKNITSTIDTKKNKTKIQDHKTKATTNELIKRENFKKYFQ